ncbi:family 20 glycosylhydrolase [Carboxylicivirga sp. N1Y90]|uniref:family 20 glycosylhydrolase n=1 Tax=Carboxylicivirga fragile TaxID=3417571 RepID=UPI003D3253D5|nr:beta-N-acetylhexosaminidase [Marinilabiliaceae bacterium N1Y90]
MKRSLLVVFVLGLLVMSISCKKSVPADLGKVSFIPQPVELLATGSSFEISKNTSINILKGDEDLALIAQLLKDEVKLFTGNDLVVNEVSSFGKNGINLGVDATINEENKEAYALIINEDQVKISGASGAGVLFGVQTFVQAIQAHKSTEKDVWIVASGQINDYPQYGFRGAMLDVARNFFEVDDVKRFIDLLVYYKLNVLHLHLTDDQGWRIEIKSWPKLTTIGGSTSMLGDGGFYTQEDYKEIVKYAKERFITIIPEIDIPGHTNAALASYAELNCNGKAPELYKGMKVGFSTLCTDKEITYQFVDDVVRELAEITDGPYIHIGGDESHVTELDDYVYFINRTQDIVKKYNKIMVGWDEIAHADIDSEAIVHYWAKGENASMGVEKGAKVILSPSTKVYLDMQYDSLTHLGQHWAAYIEIDSSYMWKPLELVEGINRENIVGIESPLWTETISTMDEIEYMVFPRIIGHAEIGWSPVEHLNWDDYKVRLGKQVPLLEKRGVDYYASKQVPWIKK